MRRFLIMVTLFAMPASAEAATVSADGAIVTYNAGRGETNDVEIFHFYGHVVVRDAGALITPGQNCVARGDHIADCAVNLSGVLGSTPTAIIALGDGPDALRVDPASYVIVRVDGGPGRDRLSGGQDPDVFLERDPPGRDVIVAGLNDIVSYAQRAGPVVVDQRGGQGEDRLLGATRIFGGHGNDVFLGSTADERFSGRGGDDRLDAGDGSDILHGGPGDDTLRGGPSSDHIYGGGGDDRLFGGRGNDYLDAGPPSPGVRAGRDRFSCGPGFDAVHGSVARDRVDATCERVSFPAEESQRFSVCPSPVRVGARTVTFAVHSFDRLRFVVRTARGRSRLLGRSPLRRFGVSRRTQTRDATFGLNAAGRRLAGRRRGVVVTVDVGHGHAWQTRLRRPQRSIGEQHRHPACGAA